MAVDLGRRAAARPGLGAAWCGGAVLWRRSAGGGTEVLLVHDPVEDEWTLPRRRGLAGETPAACALRSAGEQTGLDGTLGPPLRTVLATDGSGLPRVVHFYAVEAAHGGSEPSGGCWVDAASAARVLSFPVDVGVVEALRAHLRASGDELVALSH